MLAEHEPNHLLFRSRDFEVGNSEQRNLPALDGATYGQFPEVWAPREGAEQGDEVFVGIGGNVRDPQVVALRRKVQGQVRFLRVP